MDKASTGSLLICDTTRFLKWPNLLTTAPTVHFDDEDDADEEDEEDEDEEEEDAADAAVATTVDAGVAEATTTGDDIPVNMVCVCVSRYGQHSDTYQNNMNKKITREQPF